MKANELRIGNLVLSNNPLYRKDWLGKVLSILEIKDESVSVVAIDELPYAFTGGQFLKYIDPIPLTEEILLKCGFEKHEYMQNGYIYNGKFGFLFESFNESKERICVAFTYNFEPLDVVSLKYLHQLQNLIHALTNTELEINL